MRGAGLANLDVRLRVALCVALGLAAVAGLAMLSRVVWHSAPPTARPADPAAATRQYVPTDACLLTSGQGVDGQPQSAAWAGMRDSSLATHAQVRYLPVQGSAGALPYLASLVQRRCDVILAVGQTQDAAVDSEAAWYPGVRFITIGGRRAPHVTNIAPISAGQLRVAVGTPLPPTLRKVMAN
jgi:basic membrane lipoprotein Med (substrate-binding protein (PBP1-ABC) superfamily)